jgi:hypothetical protein
MNKENLCEAFCSRMAVREVPIGFAIRTPFFRGADDPIAIYARRSADNPQEFRLEDDGQTIAYLEASGADLDSQTRYETFVSILRDENALFSETESLIHSRPMSSMRLAEACVGFSEMLLRICDLSVLSTNRVRNTFKEDLIALVERQFGSASEIAFNAALNEGLKDYLIDIVVKSPDGRALAIYAGTSELKALEALLFSREASDRDTSKLRTMLILEQAKPAEIKERTLSRVMNSGIILASMDGEEIAVRRKMAQSLEAAL